MAGPYVAAADITGAGGALLADIDAIATQAAAASAQYYATTGAGLAATTNGQYFVLPGDGTTSYAKLYRNDTGSAVLAAQAMVSNVTAGNSYRIGSQFATIDATVEGSIIADGTASYPNKLGVNNTKPLVDPSWGARSNDAGYTAGVADVAGILGGYDNVNNALAGMIASQHSMIYTTADHATIFGGSLHTIMAGSAYASIYGGTSNKIEANCNYGVIVGGEANVLKTGGSTATSGHRGYIGGGAQNQVQAQYGAIFNGQLNIASGTYSSVINGQSCTAGADHSTAGGNSSTASGTYSWAFGNAVTVSGTRSWGFGDTITNAFDYASAVGFRTVTPFAGSRVTSARQRGNNAGYNQGLQFECSNETTDTTATRLSLYGATTYPTCPDNTHIVGTFHVAAVDDAGNISAWKIEFGCKKAAAGATPTQGAAPVVTALYDNIGVAAAPSINFTTDIFRVNVQGKAATNIRWTASFVGNMTKWT